MRPGAHPDNDDLAAMNRPARPGSRPSPGSSRARATRLDEQTLLHELWQISHFGWIPETAVRRGLTIAGGHEIPTSALHECLRQLLERGWAELRHTGADAREWRLTDSGRRHAD